MDDFQFWANKQTNYFGDPGNGNRNDLKMDISECQTLLREQLENMRFNFTVVIIICYILLIVMFFVLICFTCYEKRNITKKHNRSTQNVE